VHSVYFRGRYYRKAVLGKCRKQLNRASFQFGVCGCVLAQGSGPLRNLCSARARALAASSARLFGAVLVSSETRSLLDAAAISSTAARNTASLAFDGLLKPLTFLTNCNEAARISSSVTGGWKLKRVLMLLHTIVYLNLQSGRIAQQRLK
jgi:hypothetical protein